MKVTSTLLNNVIVIALNGVCLIKFSIIYFLASCSGLYAYNCIFLYKHAYEWWTPQCL